MTTSTINTERLLALADILDKADELHKARGEPTYFQGHYTHPCGTPACALGHWAAANPDRWTLTLVEPRLRSGGHCFGDYFDDPFDPFDDAQQEFGLDLEQSFEIFGTEGCGFAKTAKQAADYIRGFVARETLKAYR